MKKIIFIAIALTGFSTISMAQETAAPMRSPSQAQSDKETREKMQEEKNHNASATTEKVRDPNVTSFRKAGLKDKDAMELAEKVRDIDREKLQIERNGNLKPAEKQKALLANENERKKALKAAMGEEAYQKYTNQKPVRAVKKAN